MWQINGYLNLSFVYSAIETTVIADSSTSAKSDTTILHSYSSWNSKTEIDSG